MEMAARVALVVTVAWVAMVPLASMVRCLVNQEPLAEWAAMAVQADCQEWEEQQAVREQ
jgi:hypothetical protein